MPTEPYRWGAELALSIEETEAAYEIQNLLRNLAYMYKSHEKS